MNFSFIAINFQKNASSPENKLAAFSLSDLSQSLNKLSQEFIDMCDANPVTRASKAAATGAINSVANNLTYALDHPVDAAVTAAIAAACGAPGVIAWQTYKVYENWDQISAAANNL